MARANKLVLLLPPKNSSKDYERDSENILLYRQLGFSYPDLSILVEFVNGDHARLAEPSITIDSEFIKKKTGATKLKMNGKLLHPQFHYHPLFTSGSIFTCSVFDSLMPQLVSSPGLLKVIEMLAFGGSTSSFIFESAHVHQIPVPVNFVKRTYGDLFEYLTNKEIIPIALYRPANFKNAPRPYIFTNPESTTKLIGQDFVFVIGLLEKIKEFHN